MGDKIKNEIEKRQGAAERNGHARGKRIYFLLLLLLYLGGLMG